MEIGGPSWRLLGLSVLLLLVGYFSLVLKLLDRPNGLGHWSEKALLLFGAAILVSLLALAAAAFQRGFSSPGITLALGHATALSFVAALFLILEAGSSSSVPATLYSVRTLAAEAVAGYWLTLVFLLNLVLFTAWYRDSRSQVDSLIAVPVFAWGADATTAHWLAFTSGGHGLEFYVQIYWLGIAVATLVLAGILATLCVWRRWCGSSALELRALAPLAITIIVVFLDWAFSLFVLSLWLVGERSAA